MKSLIPEYFQCPVKSSPIPCSIPNTRNSCFQEEVDSPLCLYFMSTRCLLQRVSHSLHPFLDVAHNILGEIYHFHKIRICNFPVIVQISLFQLSFVFNLLCF